MLNSLPRLGRGVLTASTVAALALSAGVLPRPAEAADPVRLGMQPWPGVTVKTQVALQIMDAMGYQAEIKELSPQFVYQGIRSGDVDVTLGTWMPAHETMLQPLLDDGQAAKHAVNLKGAVQGLAVPASVCEAGITSVEDLVANGERFERKIYAIGSGAAMTEAFDKAVQADYKGLGAWQVVPSSVSGMLSQVDRRTRQDKAIVFHGWKPHWMDVKFDICFLSDDADSEIADIESTVWTVASSGWAEANPQPARFLAQFAVEPKVQSRWIYDFAYKEQPAEKVATDWISGNLDQVAAWLEGVKAANGGDAATAVREAFAGS
mgnify:CR=1 FL=1